MSENTELLTNLRDATVLHFVQSLRGGGAEQFVRELVPRLRLRQIDARVLCAYENSGLTATEESAWNGAMYCQRRSGLSRIAYFNGLRKQLRRLAPKILHTHMPAYSARTAALAERVPAIIHTEHRSVESLPLAERLSGLLLNGKINTVVVFSERTAEFVRNRDHVRSLTVIPNGVRVRNKPTEDERIVARKRLGIGNDVLVVGMISNLLSHKNPALALESIACLDPDTRSSVRLALFGDGPLRETLVARSKSLGIEPFVIFYGFRNDLAELLPGLDVALSTSNREMMPISLLEAMNAALPIVGTPHLGTLDLVVDGETGIILESWQPEDLADKIRWLLRHFDWRKNAAEAAHRRVATHFNIETVADKYAALYRRILDGARTDNRVDTR